MKYFLSLLASLGLATVCSSQNTLPPPKLLIFPFLGDPSEITGWVQSFGDDLAGLVGADFEATLRCTVVRPSPESPANDPLATTPAASKPDLILIGTVSRFGGPSPNAMATSPRTTTLDKSRKADVAIIWQLIDPSRFTVLKSGLAREVESGRAFSLRDGYIPNATLSRSNNEFTNSALGKATLAAIANLVSNACITLPPPVATTAQRDSFWKRPELSMHTSSETKTFSAKADENSATRRDIQGKILGGDSQSILIDIGRDKGVLVGQQYLVFEPAGNTTNSQTAGRDSGVIEIREVQSDLSIGVYKGSAQPQPGWLVQLR